MRAELQLDPNDFVDADEVFGDDYNPDRITWASFVVVPGNADDHATLSYYDRGHHFLGGSSGPKWAIELYSAFRYNGQALPLHDPGEPRHVLEKLSGGEDLESYNWAAQSWTYFE